MCLTEMKVSKETDDCVVLYVSVLSPALIYAFAEIIDMDHLFNLFNFCSFGVNHMKLSL